MNDFVRREPMVAELPRVLCERSPGFAASPEAALVAEDFDLPTVVADAFGEYVLRLAARGAPSQDLNAALAAVEWMAVSEDAAIESCAVIGVLSRLPELGPHTEVAVSQLRPAARALYDRWVAHH